MHTFGWIIRLCYFGGSFVDSSNLNREAAEGKEGEEVQPCAETHGHRAPYSRQLSVMLHCVVERHGIAMGHHGQESSEHRLTEGGSTHIHRGFPICSFLQCGAETTCRVARACNGRTTPFLSRRMSNGPYSQSDICTGSQGCRIPYSLPPLLVHVRAWTDPGSRQTLGTAAHIYRSTPGFSAVRLGL